MALSVEDYKKLEEKVNTFKTKHKIGFLQEEVDKLLKFYPNVNKDKFNEATNGNTVQLRDGKIVQYHCDIIKAIVCGLENRRLRASEWD